MFQCDLAYMHGSNECGASNSCNNMYYQRQKQINVYNIQTLEVGIAQLV
jgi:hypothetical protein